MKTTNRTSESTESTKQRIAIVDSHAASRIGLWRHIESLKRWEVGWASSTAEEAMEKLDKSLPVALILEIQLTGKDGLEFIKDLKPLYPDLKILVYSSQNEDFYAERCLRAGALGYLHKNKPMQLFPQALDKVLQGEIYLSGRITRKTLHSLSAHQGSHNGEHHLHRLTDRELEIMILMAQGLSSQTSADKLKISPRTVQVHRNNIRHKVGLESSLQLHSYAVRFYSDNLEPSGANAATGASGAVTKSIGTEAAFSSHAHNSTDTPLPSVKETLAKPPFRHSLKAVQCTIRKTRSAKEKRVTASSVKKVR